MCLARVEEDAGATGTPVDHGDAACNLDLNSAHRCVVCGTASLRRARAACMYAERRAEVYAHHGAAQGIEKRPAASRAAEHFGLHDGPRF